jgi:threonine/homoserine/homoserine lactone efflux protein
MIRRQENGVVTHFDNNQGDAMFDLSKFYLFLAATLVLLLVPGPAVLYIVTRSINQGRLAGLASVLGVETANFTHVVAAALGLSAILLSSALAFNIVKYLGAVYLIYLGFRTLLKRNNNGQENHFQKKENLRQIYLQGFVVNLLNPKVALFFFAFLPQFVNPNGGNITIQILMLGIIFVGMAIVTDGSYALLTSSIAYKLQGNQRFLQGQQTFSGLVYVGLGLTTALSGSSNK